MDPWDHDPSIREDREETTTKGGFPRGFEKNTNGKSLHFGDVHPGSLTAKASEKWWLEDDPFLLGRPLFLGATLKNPGSISLWKNMEKLDFHCHVSLPQGRPRKLLGNWWAMEKNRLVGLYSGLYYSVILGLFTIIRIPINQPVQWKVGGFFVTLMPRGRREDSIGVFFERTSSKVCQHCLSETWFRKGTYNKFLFK